MGIQSSHIFVNLPVKNLERSQAFFEEIGFEFDQQMTDEKGACMIVGSTIYVMLLTEDFFKSFSKREIADTARSAEVITAISANSKEEVDKLVDAAFKAGAQQASENMDDEFMYLKSFKDLDGHMWEVLYMSEEETK